MLSSCHPCTRSSPPAHHQHRKPVGRGVPPEVPQASALVAAAAALGCPPRLGGRLGCRLVGQGCIRRRLHVLAGHEVGLQAGMRGKGPESGQEATARRDVAQLCGCFSAPEQARNGQWLNHVTAGGQSTALCTRPKALVRPGSSRCHVSSVIESRSSRGPRLPAPPAAPAGVPRPPSAAA